jgi:ribonuclease P protein component
MRAEHFVIYARHTGGPARLGLVTGRKFAPRAVTRNTIRRLAREYFRTRRPELDGWDVLLRVHRRIDKSRFRSGRSASLKGLCHAEMGALFEAAIVRARRSALAAPALHHVAR